VLTLALGVPDRNPLFARYPVPPGRGPLARGGPRSGPPRARSRSSS